VKKYLFDTSLIVAGSLSEHSHYAKALPWMAAAKQGKIQASVSTHALAEVYATLTKIPIRPPLTAEVVHRFIQEEILPTFEIIDLSAKDYRQAIKRAAALSLKGGILYDCLHWQAAKKKALHGIVTFNETDFKRIVDESAPFYINPLLVSP
jgi:predicted nucleic acid-binding protein